ncbi:hypothetical protein NL676_014196 [Syzygium grande]|nr:hypothetical protein NL676_014196 [Syzygium grande]
MISTVTTGNERFPDRQFTLKPGNRIHGGSSTTDSRKHLPPPSNRATLASEAPARRQENTHLAQELVDPGKETEISAPRRERGLPPNNFRFWVPRTTTKERASLPGEENKTERPTTKRCFPVRACDQPKLRLRFLPPQLIPLTTAARTPPDGGGCYTYLRLPRRSRENKNNKTLL